MVKVTTTKPSIVTEYIRSKYPEITGFGPENAWFEDGCRVTYSTQATGLDETLEMVMDIHKKMHSDAVS